MATTITTAARRLAREHNSSPDMVTGYIFEVDLQTGRIGNLYATWAADQIAKDSPYFGRMALLRIGHGRMTEKSAQAFLDSKGQGW